MYRQIALQHHVVGENFWQAHVGGGGQGGECSGGEQDPLDAEPAVSGMVRFHDDYFFGLELVGRRSIDQLGSKGAAGLWVNGNSYCGSLGDLSVCYQKMWRGSGCPSGVAGSSYKTWRPLPFASDNTCQRRFSLA